MKDGRVVKGVNFVNIKDVGDPAEIAVAYEKQGADEIVFLDINATKENRKTMIDVVKRTAENLTVPLTVGGGIRTVEDIENLLDAGASKVSINSAAVENPSLISDAAEKFGKDSIVLAIDAKKMPDGSFHVFTSSGEKDTGIRLVDWVKKAEELNAGEILLTSMDRDGTKDGYDIEMTKLVKNSTNLPVIASGGCGKLQDFIDIFDKTNVDAALAASVFHFNELTIMDVKNELKKKHLIPAIIQEVDTGEVLMLAYVNEESLAKTIETGYTWFYSRSRKKLWNKGETSGNFQKVISITPDCDDDTLLIKVEQKGVACHTGNKTCFYRVGEIYDVNNR